MKMPVLCLASASPRRVELLARIGVVCEIQAADIDETPGLAETPQDYVMRMAQQKAEAILGQCQDRDYTLVLAADTAVVLENQILGKPVDQAEGLAMLQQLSGREHQVMTAVALFQADGEQRRLSCLNVSKVMLRMTTEAERLAYWHTGEPADKAGAYAIQGYAAIFVERLEGSFSGVMGLPLFETAALLGEFGIDVCANWAHECTNG